MRKIKFRGRSIGNHYVYGLLTKKKLRSNGQIVWAIATGNCSQAETVPVSEDSIAQLIGVDKNGAEIYEGDKVIRIAGEDNEAEKIFSMTIADFAGIRDEEEEPFQATFEDFAAIRDGEIIKCAK